MKYSFMTFSTPGLSLDETLATAKRFGYDGIEPRVACGHKHGVELEASTEERAEIKRKVAGSGVALCCIATSCRYADPAMAGQNIDATLKYIDLAADVGCPRLRVFGGPIAKDLSRENAIEVVAHSLAAVAGHAQAHGVTVCMETHDDWCDPRHVAEVMRRANHPAIAVNWDIMHPVRVAGVTMDEAFQTLRPWIRHLHVHDGTAGELALMPIGEGIIDHRRAIALLLSLGYDGYLSGEWINWEPYEVHLPRELSALRRYEEEAGG